MSGYNTDLVIGNFLLFFANISGSLMLLALSVTHLKAGFLIQYQISWEHLRRRFFLWASLFVGNTIQGRQSKASFQALYRSKSKKTKLRAVPAHLNPSYHSRNWKRADKQNKTENYNICISKYLYVEGLLPVEPVLEMSIVFDHYEGVEINFLHRSHV